MKIHLANLNRVQETFALPSDRATYFYKPFCGLEVRKAGAPLSEVASITATIAEVTCLRCLRFLINHATKARAAVLEPKEKPPAEQLTLEAAQI